MSADDAEHRCHTETATSELRREERLKQSADQVGVGLEQRRRRAARGSLRWRASRQPEALQDRPAVSGGWIGLRRLMGQVEKLL